MSSSAHRVARRFIASYVDPSILGIRPSDIVEMDDDERRSAAFDSLMRAVDLLEQVSRAFPKDVDRKVIGDAAKAVIQHARRLR